jgi:hypothetical protein
VECHYLTHDDEIVGFKDPLYPDQGRFHLYWCFLDARRGDFRAGKRR